MGRTPSIFLLFHHLLFLVIFLLPNDYSVTAAPGGGAWDLLLSNAGVSAMHMQLLNNDRVVIFDSTNFGPSNISLPNNLCRSNGDCTAHSVEYDIVSNSVRPLNVLTDTWCSSGTAMPDGSLVQTGGFKNGYRTVRVFRPCSNGACDWQESDGALLENRWYATNQILPDGRQIIIGGRAQFNYEFYPKSPRDNQSFNLPFLAQVITPRIENNLYPFVFLNVDGNLFIFANDRAILFDYVNSVVVKTYPVIPGGARNYPSTGSAVLLPLRDGDNTTVEVLVCGGAPNRSYTRAESGVFNGALDTCGRIRVNDPNPNWVIETMPLARVMGDMVLLPNGNVLIINGASAGASGWELARDPVLTPLIYRPNNQVGSRFEDQKPGSRPRMYHSTAILLRDGRVLIAGSNAHALYNFTAELYPTDITIEAFSPDYLDNVSMLMRPQIVSPSSHSQIGYGQQITITFTTLNIVNNTDSIDVTMVAPPFNTHSFSMNQRLLVLTKVRVMSLGMLTFQVEVVTPSSNILAPPGHYLLFVVYGEIPSQAIWVQIS